jgi:multiple antibiotic resistance protein
VVDGLHQFVEIVLFAVAALLPIVDPLGGAPIYLVLTRGVEHAARGQLARLVAFDSFLLLLAAVLFGTYVLDFFGLSIPDVQVAGGIVLCALGWSLLNKQDTPEALPRTAAAETVAVDISRRAFYPLTMPVTVGPGSFSVALTLGAHHASDLSSSLIVALANALGILIVAATVYFCYRYAATILRKLGATGTIVVMRLSAFILLCIGIHIAWNGIRGLLMDTFPSAAAGR